MVGVLLRLQWVRKLSCGLMAFIFAVGSVLPSFAQPSIPGNMFSAMSAMPQTGSRVSLSPRYEPAVMAGIQFDPRKPLQFNFLVKRGEKILGDEEKQAVYNKLIRYFLASLALPNKDMWVNLSPYEGDRIMTDTFSQTEMGRDLLVQDYLLKQISSSLIHPDERMGREFWGMFYRRAAEIFGTTDIPVDAFLKVWIVPDKAVIFQRHDAAVIVEQHLKVMLETDYLATQEGDRAVTSLARSRALAGADREDRRIMEDVLREVMIPVIEKEVNEGENFAPLRQVYSAMVMATWFKRALKESLLGSQYADQGKVRGIDIDGENDKQAIYEQYLEAYKKGVFNFIQEDTDAVSGEIIPRKYFSGGIKALASEMAMLITDPGALTPQQRQVLAQVRGGTDLVRTALDPSRKPRAGDVPDRPHVFEGKPFDAFEDEAIRSVVHQMAVLEQAYMQVSADVLRKSSGMLHEKDIRRVERAYKNLVSLTQIFERRARRDGPVGRIFGNYFQQVMRMHTKFTRQLELLYILPRMLRHFQKGLPADEPLFKEWQQALSGGDVLADVPRNTEKAYVLWQQAVRAREDLGSLIEDILHVKELKRSLKSLQRHREVVQNLSFQKPGEYEDLVAKIAKTEEEILLAQGSDAYKQAVGLNAVAEFAAAQFRSYMIDLSQEIRQDADSEILNHLKGALRTELLRETMLRHAEGRDILKKAIGRDMTGDPDLVEDAVAEWIHDLEKDVLSGEIWRQNEIDHRILLLKALREEGGQAVSSALLGRGFSHLKRYQEKKKYFRRTLWGLGAAAGIAAGVLGILRSGHEKGEDPPTSPAVAAARQAEPLDRSLQNISAAEVSTMIRQVNEQGSSQQGLGRPQGVQESSLNLKKRDDEQRALREQLQQAQEESSLNGMGSVASLLEKIGSYNVSPPVVVTPKDTPVSGEDFVPADVVGVAVDPQEGTVASEGDTPAGVFAGKDSLKPLSGGGLPGPQPWILSVSGGNRFLVKAVYPRIDPQTGESSLFPGAFRPRALAKPGPGDATVVQNTRGDKEIRLYVPSGHVITGLGVPKNVREKAGSLKLFFDQVNRQWVVISGVPLPSILFSSREAEEGELGPFAFSPLNETERLAWSGMLPEGVRSQVEDVMRNHRGDVARREALREKLMHSFYYTTNPGLNRLQRQEGDFIRFLFKYRAGQCTHLSFLYAYLTTILDLPPVVVASGVAGEGELGGGNLHAWVVGVDGKVVDPVSWTGKQSPLYQNLPDDPGLAQELLNEELAFIEAQSGIQGQMDDLLTRLGAIEGERSRMAQDLQRAGEEYEGLIEGHYENIKRIMQTITDPQSFSSVLKEQIQALPGIENDYHFMATVQFLLEITARIDARFPDYDGNKALRVLIMDAVRQRGDGLLIPLYDRYEYGNPASGSTPVFDADNLQPHRAGPSGRLAKRTGKSFGSSHQGPVVMLNTGKGAGHDRYVSLEKLDGKVFYREEFYHPGKGWQEAFFSSASAVYPMATPDGYWVGISEPGPDGIRRFVGPGSEWMKSVMTGLGIKGGNPLGQSMSVDGKTCSVLFQRGDSREFDLVVLALNRGEVQGHEIISLSDPSPQAISGIDYVIRNPQTGRMELAVVSLEKGLKTLTGPAPRQRGVEGRLIRAEDGPGVMFYINSQGQWAAAFEPYLENGKSVAEMISSLSDKVVTWPLSGRKLSQEDIRERLPVGFFDPHDNADIPGMSFRNALVYEYKVDPEVVRQDIGDDVRDARVLAARVVGAFKGLDPRDGSSREAFQKHWMAFLKNFADYEGRPVPQIQPMDINDLLVLLERPEFWKAVMRQPVTGSEESLVGEVAGTLQEEKMLWFFLGYVQRQDIWWSRMMQLDKAGGKTVLTLEKKDLLRARAVYEDQEYSLLSARLKELQPDLARAAEHPALARTVSAILSEMNDNFNVNEQDKKVLEKISDSVLLADRMGVLAQELGNGAGELETFLAEVRKVFELPEWPFDVEFSEGSGRHVQTMSRLLGKAWTIMKLRYGEEYVRHLEAVGTTGHRWERFNRAISENTQVTARGARSSREAWTSFWNEALHDGVVWGFMIGVLAFFARSYLSAKLKEKDYIVGLSGRAALDEIWENNPFFEGEDAVAMRLAFEEARREGPEAFQVLVDSLPEEVRPLGALLAVLPVEGVEKDLSPAWMPERLAELVPFLAGAMVFFEPGTNSRQKMMRAVMENSRRLRDFMEQQGIRSSFSPGEIPTKEEFFQKFYGDLYGIAVARGGQWLKVISKGEALDPDSLTERVLELMTKIQNLRMDEIKMFMHLPNGHIVPFVGSGGDFFDYRMYQRGDDHRFIDQNVLARTDKMVIRQTSKTVTEEVNLLIDLRPLKDDLEREKWLRQMAYSVLALSNPHHRILRGRSIHFGGISVIASSGEMTSHSLGPLRGKVGMGEILQRIVSVIKEGVKNDQSRQKQIVPAPNFYTPQTGADYAKRVVGVIKASSQAPYGKITLKGPISAKEFLCVGADPGRDASLRDFLAQRKISAIIWQDPGIGTALGSKAAAYEAAQAQAPGGIDLNDNRLEIEIQGEEGVSMGVVSDSAARIEGLVPVILGIEAIDPSGLAIFSS